jgi:hypothetical protein
MSLWHPKGAELSIESRLKNILRSAANIHRPGRAPDILLFATPRGGSTWLMEIIASQPGMKFYDEPLSPRRNNVALSGVVPNFESIMHDTGDSARIIGFLTELQAGRHRYMNPPPFRRHYRFLTDRIIFKIHEIEHLMVEAQRALGAQVVYLLRHPIATSISRDQTPRLEQLLNCSYHAAVLDNSVRHAEITALARTGSFFERKVISWCFENLVALRRLQPTWLYVSYEELVLNPERSCDLLIDRLGLRDREAMLESFDRPAANIQLSRDETLAALRSPDARRRRHRLVSKWQGKVSDAERGQAAQILGLFDIDAYDASDVLPAERFLHFSDTRAILQSGSLDAAES